MSTSYMCSHASTERDEPMLATSSQMGGWLVIEVRGAWGEDALLESALGDHLPATFKNQLKRHQIRAVCVRSHLRSESTDVRLFACATRRPGDRPAVLWRRDVGSLADVVDAAEDLRVDQSPKSGWEETTEKLILVCTNGRHDQCCANLGRPLVRALRESRWASRLWECSHIGGDRFAPNLVMLPDGLYFGRVEPESAPSLLSALDEGRIDLAKFRGRTSFSLAEQAVEHFVRRDLGIDSMDGLVIERRTSEDSFAVRLDKRRVDVRVRRHMVSVTEPLTCKGKPNQFAPAFTLESITAG